MELIAAKVQSGRYRSTGAFESDARQLLTQGKGPRSLTPEQVGVFFRVVCFFLYACMVCVRGVRAVLIIVDASFFVCLIFFVK